MKTVISDGAWTIDRIYQFIPENEWQHIEATGHRVDEQHWLWGDLANMWVRKHGMPAMLVYEALAKRIGRSQSTVRNCAYTSKFWDRDAREQYDACSWSAFNHARLCENAEQVMKYALEERCGVDELEAKFPIGAPDPAVHVPKGEWPSWAMPLFRHCVGLSKDDRAEFERLVRRLVELAEK